MPGLPHPFLPTRYRARLQWLGEVATTTGRLFLKNQLTNHAAAAALYFLLSLAPLLALVLYSVHWLELWALDSRLGSMLLAAVYDRFRVADLRSLGLIPDRVPESLGWFGAITLLLASRGFLSTLQSAFRVIFPEPGRRGILLSWLLPLVLLPLVLAAAIVTVLGNSLLHFFAQPELLGALRSLVLQWLSGASTLLLIWLLIWLAYWRLPLRPPPARLAALTAALATVSATLVPFFFVHWASEEKYRTLYGGPGSLVFFLVAVYFVCVAFFLWAQCLYALTKADVAGLEKLLLSVARSEQGDQGLGAAPVHWLLQKYGQRHAAGSVIVREGDAGETAYYLYAGRVSLYHRADGQERLLASLGPGELFGEIAHLLHEKRSATVRADSDVIALALPPDLLEELMKYSAPLSQRIIHALSQRLMHMNAAAGAV